VPGTPSGFSILDIGPNSARVEWTSSSLPADNGGARVHTVRLTYKEVNEEVWSSAVVEEDVAQMYAVVTGLTPQRTYQIRMQARNSIGTSE